MCDICCSDINRKTRIVAVLLNLTHHSTSFKELIWLVVYLPLWKIMDLVRQLGWFFHSIPFSEWFQSLKIPVCSSLFQSVPVTNQSSSKLAQPPRMMLPDCTQEIWIICFNLSPWRMTQDDPGPRGHPPAMSHGASRYFPSHTTYCNIERSLKRKRFSNIYHGMFHNLGILFTI